MRCSNVGRVLTRRERSNDPQAHPAGGAPKAFEYEDPPSTCMAGQDPPYGIPFFFAAAAVCQNGSMNDTDALLASARQLHARGHADAAAASYSLVLQRLPVLAEAHAFLASHALQCGVFAAAVAHGERVLQTDPDNVPVHALLGDALRRLVTFDSAERALHDILGDQPQAYTSGLHHAWLLERRGDTQAALLGYLRSIKTAQLRGFWRDDDSTPPWLRERVQHAMQRAQSGRRQFFHALLDGMIERYGRNELSRVAECLSMYLGESPTVYADPRQRPTFLYFPGLPVTPVFDRAQLSFAEAYEARMPAIREEMRSVLAGADGIEPFHYDLTAEQRDAMTRGAAWDAYFFDRDGVRLQHHHAACPETSATLAQLPLDHIRDHGPEVCFSIMRPGAHILPHRGVTNTRSVLHLGLVIPDRCALNLVEVGEVHWQEGRCFAFDDTYEHEAWNRSDATRVILLADIWNPHLSEAERAAVADLIAAIGDLNKATAAAKRDGLG
jgi:aspartate beta-hydroxylase